MMLGSLTPRAIAARARRFAGRAARDARGYTLIELLIAASLGITITMIGFSALYFVQTNVSHADEQVHIDQTGRVVLENLMLELHSGCIAPKAKPIQANSTGSILKFVNARAEAPRTEAGKEEAHVKPYLHEVIYEESKEKLYEKKWEGEETESGSGEYKFNGTPTERLLAKHVVPLWETPEHKATLPIFRYYRYYEEGDAGYEAGKLNETPLTTPLSSNQSEKNAAVKVAKVTVSFSIAPSAKNNNSKLLEPVALEDSAVYRLTPASTAESPAPQPCA
jgi:hypothetical protein